MTAPMPGLADKLDTFRRAVLQLLTAEQVTELARLHDEHVGWDCAARSEGQTCCIDLLGKLAPQREDEA